MNLNDPLSVIPRLGPTAVGRFKKLDIQNLRDLIYFFPFRYEDFTRVTEIKDITEEKEVNVVGWIELIQNRRSRKKRMNLTEALIKDDSGEIKALWFNQPFLTRNLKVGDKISLAGKVKTNFGEPVLMSPVYEKITDTGKAVHTLGIVPHYHSTEKLTQKQIRFAVKSVLPLINQIRDWLPENIKKESDLINLNAALKEIHFPSNYNLLDKAQRRLSFNELFLIQLKSRLIKKELRSSQSLPVNFKRAETKNFVENLPFKLTDAQRKSAWEIIRDLEKEKPMARLLEGDVGSGKTLVAVLAMLNTALNSDFRQSVLMVPTEILAEQHFNSISRLLKDYPGIKIGLLTKDKRKTNQDALLKNTKSKKAQAEKISQNCEIIIGTHSLIQEEVNFSCLALAIIDEQHRFGVEQRKKLVEKSGDSQTVPHLLSMTATPIPRSLALALFGDLDISIIDELPGGRKPVLTRVVPEEKREKAYEFIKEKISEGRQIFVICPLIDPSDKLGVKSAREEYEKLQNKVFPRQKIAMLHGRLKGAEKEEIMADFLAGKYDLLVSTSVVEVGVDVPNASIMVIEGAERFGLAQLHQFRGRVGRGAHQSYCFLFTDSDNEQTRERLKALEKYRDGFKLSQIDLKLRGSGDLYGTAQKGFPQLKIADLFDYQLMREAQTRAEKIARQDPSLNNFPYLKEKFADWKREIHPE